MNLKNHHVYTTKFNLYVVDLTQIELATEEDRESGLVYWTKIFKAKTWEELKQMAERNQELQEATEALYVYNQDEIVKEKCRARQDYYNHERGTQKRLEEARLALEESKKLLKKSVKLLAESQHISEEEACKQIGINRNDYENMI